MEYNMFAILEDMAGSLGAEKEYEKIYDKMCGIVKRINELDDGIRIGLRIALQSSIIKLPKGVKEFLLYVLDAEEKGIEEILRLMKEAEGEETDPETPFEKLFYVTKAVSKQVKEENKKRDEKKDETLCVDTKIKKAGNLVNSIFKFAKGIIN